MPKEDESLVKVSLPGGAIATAPTIATGEIRLIETVHGSTRQTIYDSNLHEGTPPAELPHAQIPVGTNWEVHVTVKAYSPEGYWAQAVTICATSGALEEKFRRQHWADRKIRSGDWNVRVEKNMGEMQEQQFFVGLRIKHWLSDAYRWGPAFSEEVPEEIWCE